jgi:hypothetical protein
MMELIKQRFLNISLYLGILTLLLFSCIKKSVEGSLECILDNINVDKKGINIEVGQHNGWTDATVLILVTYHKKSNEISISGNLKGEFRGNDIYFYQSNIDSLDKKKYKQISNNINWQNYIPLEMDEDYISPPYDPINIQIEYSLKKECIVQIINGEGFINKNRISVCMCVN